jgi:hypothetical protein
MTDFSLIVSIATSVLTGVITAVSVVAILKNDISWMKELVSEHKSHHEKHFHAISDLKERIARIEKSD